MRKRNIKTVAHWVIMCFLLLFPIVLVGISAFANDEQSVTVNETYEYETNEVNSYNDLILNHIYKVNGYFENFTDTDTNGTLVGSLLFLDSDSYCEITIGEDNFNDSFLYGTFDFKVSRGFISLYINDAYILSLDNITFSGNVYFVITYINSYNGSFVDLLSASDYLGQVTTDVEITETNYKQEVNNWANGFKNLPVNQWYGQLLDVIGVGQTTNSVMNVIYVYPLYVLWVYLIDLIVDCLLVVVHFGHNALSRLGGDND